MTDQEKPTYGSEADWRRERPSERAARNGLVDQARALLGHRVRVWPAADLLKATRPVIEGKVVGIAPDPMLCIRTDDGRQQDWMVSLPHDDLGEQERTPDLEPTLREERAYADGLRRAFIEARDAVATAPGLPHDILLKRITHTAQSWGVDLDA